MYNSSPPDIIILVADDSTAQRFRRWVSDINCRVCCDNEPVPDNVGVIKVCDSDPTGLSDFAKADSRIILPGDVSRRELRTVCHLMLEIVDLRRSLRSADRQSERFKQESFTDPLSGLPNRRHWEESLQRQLDRVDENRLLCLAIVDLDHFKQVNSDYGHAAGDQVLQRVAASMHMTLREDDFLARLGGDEFGLLFWVTEPRFAGEVVERVRKAIGRLDISEVFAGDSGRRITASAGYVIANQGISSETLFSAADMAMLSAKQQGRDRSVSHEERSDG